MIHCMYSYLGQINFLGFELQIISISELFSDVTQYERAAQILLDLYNLLYHASYSNEKTVLMLLQALTQHICVLVILPVPYIPVE